MRSRKEIRLIAYLWDLRRKQVRIRRAPNRRIRIVSLDSQLHSMQRSLKFREDQHQRMQGDQRMGSILQEWARDHTWCQ